MRPLRIVYDGECPFCSRYVRLVRLREQFAVELIDARRRPEEARRYGLDLNEGMIADIDGDVHHGSDAVWALSMLSSRSGFWNAAMARVFRSRALARILYPFMRMGRRVVLMLLGRPAL